MSLNAGYSRDIMSSEKRCVLKSRVPFFQNGPVFEKVSNILTFAVSQQVCNFPHIHILLLFAAGNQLYKNCYSTELGLLDTKEGRAEVFVLGLKK